MNPTLKWWYAQFYLGFCTLRHYVKKLWPWRKKAGLLQFKNNYVVEGLPAFSSSFRELAYEPSRCTVCGLCDAACYRLRLENQKQFLGPRRLVNSVMRGGPLIQYALEELKSFQEEACLTCKQCEKSCPEEIPILELSKEFFQQWQQVKNRDIHLIYTQTSDCNHLKLL